MWQQIPWPYRIARVALILLAGDLVSRPPLGDQPWHDVIQLLSGALIVACGVSVGTGRHFVAPGDRAEQRLVGVSLSVMGLLIALGALLFALQV